MLLQEVTQVENINWCQENSDQFKDDEAVLTYYDCDCHVPLTFEMRVKEFEKLKGGTSFY